MGIRAVFDEWPIYSQHIRKALRGAFQPSGGTPPPMDTTADALLIRDTPPKVRCSFLGSHLSYLERLVEDCQAPQAAWEKRILPSIAPDSGRFHTVAISQISRHFDLRGKQWIWKFANGRHVTGKLPQDRLLPPSDKAAPMRPIAELYRSASARFCDRAPNYGRRTPRPCGR